MNNKGLLETPTESASVFTKRTVKHGFEERFGTALHYFIAQSLQAEGHLGVSIMRPVEGRGSHEYGILRRFRDAVSRDNFYESPQFKQWEVTVASLTEGEAKHQHLSAWKPGLSFQAKGQ
jgi:antibiotic biosynthesis monooxygenase (ABM) superfamily enzyme